MWNVYIGQPFVLQERIGNISVTHEKNYSSYSIEILHSTVTERNFVPGRLDSQSILIKRNDETVFVGYIEDVDPGETTKYYGRDARILLEKSTEQNLEYKDKSGEYIINDLITTYCSEISVDLGDIDYSEVLGGTVRCGGEKVSKIITELCDLYDREWWIEVTIVGNSITARNINIGTKSRGSQGSPYVTLNGGIEISGLPVRKNKSRKTENKLLVKGKGSKSGRVTAICEDLTSQALYGIIEGEPYENNLISDEKTAKNIGDAIIAAKKDLSIDVSINLAKYIDDLEYGDWVRILDSYTETDVTKRVVKCTYKRILDQADTKDVEFGNNYSSYNALLKQLNRKLIEDSSVMTDQDGILNVHSTTPESTSIIIDAGTYYGIDGVKITYDGETYAIPSGIFTLANRWKKILLQISGDKADIVGNNALSIVHGTEYADKASAEAEDLDSTDTYIPVAEIIMHCEAVPTTYEYIYEYTTSYNDNDVSYIYREVRPFIGTPLSESISGGSGSIDKLLGTQCETYSNVEKAFLFETPSTYTDYTTEINDDTVGDVYLFPASPEENDAFYFGHEIPFDLLRLEMSTAGAGTWGIYWEYWDGAAWATLSDITDPTNGFTTSGTHNITFTIPGGWKMATINSNTRFWIRARIASFSSMSIRPQATQGYLSPQPSILNGTYAEKCNIIIQVPATGYIYFRKTYD